MILQSLLGDVSVSEFMDRHFLKLPFATTSTRQNWSDLVNWDALDQILAQEAADVLVGRSHQGTAERPRSAAEAQALMAQGQTIGIRHAERQSPALAALAAEFQAAFRAPVDVHVYCTPANQPGFGWHYDAEEVFILQCAGDKHWELRKNTVNPWPLLETLPVDMRSDREIMPVMRCHLLTGDWLYVPTGYWHRTTAGTESISISVGVLMPTAIDLLDFVRRELLTSLRWRQRLPPAGEAAGLDQPALIGAYQERCRELLEDLSVILQRPATLAAFLDRSFTSSQDL